MRAAFAAFPSAGQSWIQQPFASFWAWKSRDAPAPPGVSVVLSSRILPAPVLAANDTAALLARAIVDAARGGVVDVKIGLLLGGAAGVDRDNDTSVNQLLRGGLWHVSGCGTWQGDATPDAEQQNITAQTRAFGDALRALVRVRCCVCAEPASLCTCVHVCCESAGAHYELLKLCTRALFLHGWNAHEQRRQASNSCRFVCRACRVANLHAMAPCARPAVSRRPLVVVPTSTKTTTLCVVVSLATLLPPYVARLCPPVSASSHCWHRGGLMPCPA